MVFLLARLYGAPYIHTASLIWQGKKCTFTHAHINFQTQPHAIILYAHFPPTHADIFLCIICIAPHFCLFSSHHTYTICLTDTRHMRAHWSGAKQTAFTAHLLMEQNYKPVKLWCGGKKEPWSLQIYHFTSLIGIHRQQHPSNATLNSKSLFSHYVFFFCSGILNINSYI